ncbi:MAG: zinc ribbon domain-containing protein, partial [bacterium]
MTTTANSLREIHSLHQRARAIQDRLASHPKTVAARNAIVAKREATLDQAKKELQQAKVAKGLKETQRKSVLAKIEDFSTKLLSVKKNEEYKAIQNEIALLKSQMAKLDDELIEGELDIDDRAAKIKELEAEVAKLKSDMADFQKKYDENKPADDSNLADLSRQIAEAEAIIPIEIRDSYQRVIRQRGADALAIVEEGACSGCFMAVTSQMVNDLINCDKLVFCRSCGRVLYMA